MPAWAPALPSAAASLSGLLLSAATAAGVSGELDEDTLEYLTESLTTALEEAESQEEAREALDEVLAPHWEAAGAAEGSVLALVETILKACTGVEAGAPVATAPPTANAPLVSSQNIILALGGNVLLERADLQLYRGRRYFILGRNGVGKTTLCRRIASREISGWPQDVGTFLVPGANLLDAPEGASAREYARAAANKSAGAVGAAPVLAADPIVAADKALERVGFRMDEDEGKTGAGVGAEQAVSALSGGWRMRLALATSLLHPADVLIFDEPSNHLDAGAVQWLIGFLQSGELSARSVVVVSHDKNFVRSVCTDVIHFHDKLLAHYPDYAAFAEAHPELAAAPSDGAAVRNAGDGHSQDEEDEEAAALAAHRAAAAERVQMAQRLADAPGGRNWRSMSERSGSSAAAMAGGASAEDVLLDGADDDEGGGGEGPLKFTFPTPGPLEGVKGKSRKILSLDGAVFRYDADATTPAIIEGASVKLTPASRVAVTGPNGAGKTTLVRLLVGELVPISGDGFRHPSAQVAYVAQHTRKHLEEHLSLTPMQYLKRRFGGGNALDGSGVDAEFLARPDVALTAEEEAERQSGRNAINAIVGRRKKAGQLEYEVRKNGRTDTMWEPLVYLKAHPNSYVSKLVLIFDEQQRAAESGAALRPTTTLEVLEHFKLFGLSRRICNTELAGLSDGQKCRVVLASCFWPKPHVVILDEPTNFLDADSAWALATSLRTFRGACLCVSHDKLFLDRVCDEEWVVPGDGGVSVVPWTRLA